MHVTEPDIASHRMALLAPQEGHGRSEACKLATCISVYMYRRLDLCVSFTNGMYAIKVKTYEDDLLIILSN